MKKMLKILIIAFFVLIFCLVCYWLICEAKVWPSNVATMTSGVLSALATVLLGGIALWQTYRYKRAQDVFIDLYTMPEFYKPNTLASIVSASSSAIQTKLNCIFYKSGSNIMEFNLDSFIGIRGPLLNLRPSKLVIDRKDALEVSLPCSEINLFETSGNGFMILGKVPFSIEMRYHDYELVLSYSNISNICYRKTISFRLSDNGEYNNLIIKKAERDM